MVKAVPVYKRNGTIVYGVPGTTIPTGATSISSAEMTEWRRKNAIREAELERRRARRYGTSYTPPKPKPVTVTEPKPVTVTRAELERMKEAERQRRISETLARQKAARVPLKIPTKLPRIKKPTFVVGPSYGPPTPRALEKPFAERVAFVEKEVVKARAKGKPMVFTGFMTGLALTGVETAKLAKALVTKPVSTVKAIGVGLKTLAVKAKTGVLAKEIGIAIKTKPSVVAGRVVGELLLMKGIGKVVSTVGKGAEIGRTVISPKYAPLKAGVIKVPKVKGITEIKIAPPVKKILIPLKEQVTVAGKKVTAVSAARDFFKPFEKVKVIEKPKPALKAPEIERALFADPAARLRISRLGVLTQKEAGIMDILRGEVTFKKAKPQVLLFEETQVAKIPKGLKDIEKALKKGKPLTQAQMKRFQEWQLKPTGEFKPIGKLTREPEITLAPGEIITKEAVSAVTLIKGKRVVIIKPKIKKAPPAIKKLLEKPRRTPRETTKLAKMLAKETGISRAIITKPYLSPAKIISLIPKLPRVTKPYIPRPYKPPKLPKLISPIKITKPYKPPKIIRPISLFPKPPKITKPYVPLYKPPKIIPPISLIPKLPKITKPYIPPPYKPPKYPKPPVYIPLPIVPPSIPSLRIAPPPYVPRPVKLPFKFKFGAPGKPIKIPVIYTARRAAKYMPSLIAMEKKIRGGLPKFLTGLEVRPIT